MESRKHDAIQLISIYCGDVVFIVNCLIYIDSESPKSEASDATKPCRVPIKRSPSSPRPRAVATVRVLPSAVPDDRGVNSNRKDVEPFEIVIFRTGCGKGQLLEPFQNVQREFILQKEGNSSVLFAFWTHQTFCAYKCTIRIYQIAMRYYRNLLLK